jgi:hypothetical protein
MLAVSADPRVSGARASRWFAAAVGIASALLAYALTGPLAIGGHDEGVYLATARALAESGEYRLINLPSAPLQTKYPPAYAALLALMKRGLHLDARQVRPLKAINAACLIAIVFLTSELARTLSGGSLGASVVAALLTSTSLALVSQVDVIGSDSLFVALLLGALVMMERRSPIQTMIAGCLLGAATLTRTVGLAAILGTLSYEARQPSRRRLWLLVPALTISGAWLLWSAAYRAHVGPIEGYYVVYSPLMWLNALSEPAFTWRVVFANVLEYLKAAPLIFGVPEPVTATAFVVGAALGGWSARRHVLLRHALAMATVYGLVLVGFPAAFSRYLLPAVPLAYAVVACGVSSQARAGRRLGAAPIVAWACVLAVLVANVVEVRQYSQQSPDRIPVGFGLYLPFQLAGFIQTADWIRRNTPDDARLGSSNDTAYFTLTGRRGVRPWPYEPELYNPHYGPAPPSPPIDVPNELARLGVDYIIVDPYLQDVRPYAEGYLNHVLRAPGHCWTLAFTSDNTVHQVYRRAPAAACAAR